MRHVILIAAALTLTAAASAQWFGGGIRSDPPADFAAEYAALDEASRPSPDAENGWPAFAAFFGLLDEAAYRASNPDVADEAVPEFRRIYLPETPWYERGRLSGLLRESRATGSLVWLSSSNWYEPWSDDYDAFLDDFEHALRVMEFLREDERLGPCLAALSEIQWIAPPRNRELEYEQYVEYGGRRHAFTAMLRTAWLEGDLDGVRRTIRAFCATSNAIARVPNFFWLFGSVNLDYLMRELQDLITHSPPPAGWAEAVLADLEAVERLPHWSISLEALRLEGLEQMDREFTGEPGGDGVWIGMRDDEPGGAIFATLAPTRRQVRTVLDDQIEAAIRLGLSINEDRIRALSDHAREELDRMSPSRHVIASMRGYWPHYALLLPSNCEDWMLMYDRIQEVCRGMYDATRAMLLIERHKHLTGAYPKNLDDIDDPRLNRGLLPFWGQPLLYHRHSDGDRTYTLYVPGPDNLDNDGYCDWETREGGALTSRPFPEGMDFVFRGKFWRRYDPRNQIDSDP